MVASFSLDEKSTKKFEFAENGVCIRPAEFVDNSNEQVFTMKNVPGEGDCMFLAVALATLASMGLGGNDALLRAISRETREIVAGILEQRSGNLIIEGKRLVATSTLLQSAAKREGLEPQEYLRRLRLEGRNGGLYGGGPELTVLCNVLRRPISVYELDDDAEEDITRQSVVCKGAFGADLLKDPLRSLPDAAVLSSGAAALPGAYSWHLHILVLDVSKSEKHACVLLPQPPKLCE